MKILILSLLFSQFAFAQTGAKLLIQGDETVNLKSVLTQEHIIKLDNPFKVQAYTNFKTLGIQEVAFHNWMMLIFADDLSKALTTASEIANSLNSKTQTLFDFSLAYIYWQQNFSQLFISKWFELSQKNLLTTDLGVALDQFIIPMASAWLKKNHMVLSKDQQKQLVSIKNLDLRFNHLLQAFSRRQNGEESLDWVSKLEDTDSYKQDLIYSSILYHANNGKLAISGKLIQDGIEPLLEKSNSLEQVSYYYLTLARLLYQARAFTDAIEYYSLIPDSSRYFLSARVEKVWSHLQLNELSKAQAEVQTLKHPLFHDRFLPDVFLTSAIVNLKTCQFLEVQKDLNSFVEINSKWPDIIEKNLKSEMPEILNADFVTDYQKRREILTNELNQIGELIDPMALKPLYENMITEINSRQTKLIHNQWQNRQKLLDDAIYRMKFVRIELLSQMRNLALNIPLSNTDQVSIYQAAPARKGALVFPNDGKLWGDDLFSVMAQVQNLCLKGLK
jgi:hypothetical protein